jgi:hypothetical protein
MGIGDRDHELVVANRKMSVRAMGRFIFPSQVSGFSLGPWAHLTWEPLLRTRTSFTGQYAVEGKRSKYARFVASTLVTARYIKRRFLMLFRSAGRLGYSPSRWMIAVVTTTRRVMTSYSSITTALSIRVDCSYYAQRLSSANWLSESKCDFYYRNVILGLSGLKMR